jgi:hypothetical protein
VHVHVDFHDWGAGEDAFWFYEVAAGFWRLLDGGGHEVAILEEVAVDADLVVFSICRNKRVVSVLHATRKAGF